MMKTARQRSAIILSCLLALSACSAEPESIEQWMQHTGKDLQGKVEPLPPVQPYEPYQFQSAQLGSPFDPARLQLAHAKLRRLFNGNRPREALENYELSQLKLTGILRFNKQYFGLIQTPDNGIYRVRPGSFVGPNFGIVRKVSETEVVLEETVENINGEWGPQISTLHLPQPQQSESEAYKQIELLAEEAESNGLFGQARKLRLQALHMLPLQQQLIELELLAKEAESQGLGGVARTLRARRAEVLHQQQQGAKQ